MDFTGKAFLIMGATSGVGKAVCRLLSDEGASLFLTGRDRARLDKLRDSLVHPDRHEISLVEITEDSYSAMSQDLMKFIKERSLEGISGGVYCPGIAMSVPVKAFDWDVIQRMLNVNFTGALMFTKLLIHKKFRMQNGGSIVLITSIRSQCGAKSLGIYGGSKAAIAGACRSMAVELAPYNYRINCIVPGSLGTEMNLQTAKFAPAYLQDMASKHPLGLGTPQDAANAIAFLLSDKSKWITGTEMVVDGGFLA